MKVIDNIKLLKIDTSSFSAAQRDITARFKMGTQVAYEDLILDLVCEPLGAESTKEAEMLFCYLVQETVRQYNLGNLIEKDEAIAIARQRTNEFIAKNPWAIVKDVPQVTVVEGVEVSTPTVARVKRGSGGSKKDRCLALYRANPTLDRKAFIALFMKELGLSIPGATTYVYNCMKGVWK